MEVYTDGSSIVGCDGIRYGGSGIWFSKDDIRNSSIPLRGESTTNQLAELTAILYALRFCKSVPQLIIKSDSVYSIKCVTLWHKAWKQNGWKTSKGNPVLYADIIQEMLSIINSRSLVEFSTSFVHIRGHRGIEGNEGADKLASAASKEAYSLAMHNTIFFDGGILSQFHPSNFKGSGDLSSVVFSHAEQWYHYHKALYFKDFAMASKILQTREPHIQKRLGRQVENFDTKEWEKVAFEVVVQGNILKFSQNPIIGEYLKSTRGKRLVEARPDSIWGIGISVAQAMNREYWRGNNLLGKALMYVRSHV